MSKILSFVRVYPPSHTGYDDMVSIHDEDGGTIASYKCRTTPNPSHPKTNKQWDRCYGCLALGIYSGKWGNDSRGRYCVILEEGKELPAILPNANHGNRCVIRGVEIHSGFKDDDPRTPANEAWSGSAGCLTIPPALWDDFCHWFKPGEVVKIELRGMK